MSTVSRWLASTALSAALVAGLAIAAPAQAQTADDLVRVIVDVADVAMRGGQPYYRYGNYGYDDRLTYARDRYGRPVYYRYVPRNTPPYGNAYGYYRNAQYGNGYGMQGRTKCNPNGKCKVEYYDPRYDRKARDPRYGYERARHDHDDRGRWDD